MSNDKVRDALAELVAVEDLKRPAAKARVRLSKMSSDAEYEASARVLAAAPDAAR